MYTSSAPVPDFTDFCNCLRSRRCWFRSVSIFFFTSSAENDQPPLFMCSAILCSDVAFVSISIFHSLDIPQTRFLSVQIYLMPGCFLCPRLHGRLDRPDITLSSLQLIQIPTEGTVLTCNIVCLATWFRVRRTSSASTTGTGTSVVCSWFPRL